MKDSRLSLVGYYVVVCIHKCTVLKLGALVVKL